MRRNENKKEKHAGSEDTRVRNKERKNERFRENITRKRKRRYNTGRDKKRERLPQGKGEKGIDMKRKEESTEAEMND